MQLSDILDSDSIEDMLSDDPLEDALEDMILSDDFEVGFLGKFVKGIGKGLGSVVKGVAGVGKKVIDNPVFKIAMPVAALANSKAGLAMARNIPGYGQVIGLGLDAATALQKGGDLTALGGQVLQAYGGQAGQIGAQAMQTVGGKSLSMSATPAVMQANIKAGKASAQPRKALVVAKPSASVRREPKAVAVSQPAAIVVKAAPLDISRIVGNFSASVSPQLNAIAGLLKAQQLQTQAQSEHNKRVKDANFKRHVVKQLAVKG